MHRLPHQSCAREYFADRFTRLKSHTQAESAKIDSCHLHKYKKIEQSHIGFVMKGVGISDERSDALSIATAVIGGGMSSRLFQKIREELGLAYSVYAFPSAYKNEGLMEICAGVNTESRDLATQAIVDEVRKFKRDKITEQEFSRAKEQLKSSTLFSRESTNSQMHVYGRHLLFLDKEFDYDDRIKKLEKVTINDVSDIIEEIFDIDSASTATVGPKKTSLKFS